MSSPQAQLQHLGVPPDFFEATDLNWKRPADLRELITVNGLCFSDDQARHRERAAAAYDDYMTAATGGAPEVAVNALRLRWERHGLGEDEHLRRVDALVRDAAIEGRWIAGAFIGLKAVLIPPGWWRFLDLDVASRRASGEDIEFRDVRFIIASHAPAGFCPWVQNFFDSAAAALLVETSKTKGAGGRPLKHDWGAFDAEVVRIANTPDGLPERAILHRCMMDWWQRTGREEPSESQVRDRLAKLYPKDKRGF